MKNLYKLSSLLIVAVFLSYSKVYAQELRKEDKFFKTNYYYGDELIPKKEFVTHLATNSVAIEHWNKSRTFNTLYWVSVVSEYGFITWSLTDGKDKNPVASTGVYGSLAMALLFHVISESHVKKSIENYNKEIKKVTFSPSKTGFGLVMSF